MEAEFYERHLPHWHPAGAYLFLTGRLAGSLPAPLLFQLRAEYAAACEQAEDEAALRQLKSQHFGRFDGYLDAGLPDSPRWLAVPAVARVVLDALRWRAERGAFELLVACVMSNHWHGVVKLPLKPARPFSEELRDFKQYTAGQANRLLGRHGPFWQSETYDHVVRDAHEGGLERVIRYVLNNPVKAGLCVDWLEWPHTYCAENVA